MSMSPRDVMRKAAPRLLVTSQYILVVASIIILIVTLVTCSSGSGRDDINGNENGASAHSSSSCRDSCAFAVPEDYDFSLSTSDNYEEETCAPTSFNDRYGKYRLTRNYSYHKCYVSERVDYQNCLLDSMLRVGASRPCRYSKEHGAIDISRVDISSTAMNNLDEISPVSISTDGGCERGGGRGGDADERRRPWLVFTAGVMGVGKGHVLLHMSRRQTASFPLDRFVRVDPDEFRSLIPETRKYFAMNPTTSGSLTHLECGFLSELATEAALDADLDTLVDSSLRDYEYFSSYIDNVRNRYPRYKVGIVYVTVTDPEIAKRRSIAREGKILRKIPENLIEDTHGQVSRSMIVLGPLADIVITVDNDGVVPIILNISISNLISNPTDEYRINFVYGQSFPRAVGVSLSVDEGEGGDVGNSLIDQDMLYSIIRDSFAG